MPPGSETGGTSMLYQVKKVLRPVKAAKTVARSVRKNRREYGILWERLQKELQKIVKGRKNLWQK